MEFLSNKNGKLDIAQYQALCEQYCDLDCQVAIAEDCGDKLQYFQGVKYALENRNSNKPLLLLSMVPLGIILKIIFRETMVLLSQEKVLFASIIGVEQKIEELALAASQKVGNEAGLYYLEGQQKNYDVSIIHHSLGGEDRLRDSNRRARAADEARKKLKFVGTDDEVVEQLIIARQKLTVDEIPAGRFFSGIFCDVQGTLLEDDDKTINQSVFSWLKKREQEGQQITVWTGAEPKEMALKLYSTKEFRENNIQWPVVSKNSFAGATVEEALDDDPRALKNLLYITAEISISPKDLAI